MENPQLEIINAVCGFLEEKGIYPRLPGASAHGPKHSVEVVNRDGDFPVTIRLQFLDGQFCGVLTGMTDDGISEYLKQGGGLALTMKAHWFEIGDTGFLDQVFAFVKNPYCFLDE